ncbi:MAG: hypothetical protein ACXVB0_19920 [Mucilaginibacter sp.]
MKNFQKLASGLIIGAMAIGFSAFTTPKRVNSNFYVYTSSSHLQADIQNINNYAASAADPCGPTTTNVCGVDLATSRPVGSTPVAAEFNAEKADLWSSQTAHSPQDANIEMKP